MHQTKAQNGVLFTWSGAPTESLAITGRWAGIDATKCRRFLGEHQGPAPGPFYKGEAAKGYAGIERGRATALRVFSVPGPDTNELRRDDISTIDLP